MSCGIVENIRPDIMVEGTTQAWRGSRLPTSTVRRHSEFRKSGSGWDDPLFPPHAQRICHSIDVVEPCCDERDLQDADIVESGCAQALMIHRSDLCCVLRELDHVVEHDLIGVRGGSRAVVAFQRADQCLIERDPTQKLCVRFNSIDAPILH